MSLSIKLTVSEAFVSNRPSNMNSAQNQAFLDIEVHDWCTEQRLLTFKKEYLSHLDVFAFSPQSHDLFIQKWIHAEHIKSLQVANHHSLSLENVEITDLVKDWSNNRHQSVVAMLSENKLIEYASLEALMLQWATDQWGHRLESLYLERKANLDKISCSLMRMKEPLLAAEIYHRLNSDNIPFEQLSWQFGEGPERKHAGYFPLMHAIQFPEGFLPLIKKLKVGEILKPHRIGKWNVIIQLHELIQAQFDFETKCFILKGEVQAWTEAVSKKLLSSLE